MPIHHIKMMRVRPRSFSTLYLVCKVAEIRRQQ
jgi:hypothetical protein